MKRLVIGTMLLVLAVTVNSFSAPQKKQKKEKKTPEIVEKTYDRFKDFTTIKIALGDIDGMVFSLRMKVHTLSYYQSASVLYAYPGQTVTQPSEIVFHIVSRMPVWIYLNDSRALTLLVDGKQLTIGAMLYSGTLDTNQFGEGVVAVEFLDGIIPRETFLRLANASSVEGQVGGAMEFKFRENQLRAFKTLVETWELGDGPDSAPVLPTPSKDKGLVPSVIPHR